MKTKLLIKIRKKARKIYKIRNLFSGTPDSCTFEYRSYTFGTTKWHKYIMASSATKIKSDILKFKKETLDEIEWALFLYYRNKYHNHREKEFIKLLIL